MLMTVIQEAFERKILLPGTCRISQCQILHGFAEQNPAGFEVNTSIPHRSTRTGRPASHVVSPGTSSKPFASASAPSPCEACKPAG